jgi:hypothetical protein
VTDEPVMTAYPHDRLSRLADAMSAALSQQPGAEDVRAVVLLNDAEGGCIHLFRYEDPVEGLAHESLLFLDLTTQLMEMGRGLGLRVQVLVASQEVRPG